MSDQYASVSGFVQFDPATKDVNGQTILSFAVRSNWPGQPLVQITLWGEYAGVFDTVVKGAFVAADGKYKQNMNNGKTYHNLSASSFALMPAVEKAERSDAAPALAGSTESVKAPF